MKLLGVIVFFVLVIWLASKFYKWDDEKNDGFGCGMIALVGTILMFVIGAVSTFKSCGSDSDNGPSYDYYEDRAR